MDSLAQVLSAPHVNPLKQERHTILGCPSEFFLVITGHKAERHSERFISRDVFS